MAVIGLLGSLVLDQYILAEAINPPVVVIMRPAASIGIRDRGIPHSPPCERLSTEAVPMPPPYTSARQQFDQVTVSPRLEQARQADRCTNDVTSGWLVDPYPPDHAAKPLRVFLHELGVDGDLSPSILDWREVLHAIVHDCLKQPFEPCAPRFHVNRRRDQYRDHIIERVVDDPAKDARGRVDVLQGRPKSHRSGANATTVHERTPAVRAGHRIAPSRAGKTGRSLPHRGQWQGSLTLG